MTIKKQFILLTTIIVIIPVLCILFISLENYIKSPRRLLLHNYDSEIYKFTESLTPRQQEQFLKFLNRFSSSIEFTIISEDRKVIHSNIDEISVGSFYDRNILSTLISKTSDIYIYQITSEKLDDTSITIISRVERKNLRRRRNNISKSLIIFLFIIVLICVFIIVYTSRIIFKSIMTIKNQTNALANGDLSIDLENDTLIKENEIISISSNLEKMRISLLEAQNHKNKFIMGISHDLRTPVAIIKGYSEALRDGIISSEEEISTTYDLILSKSSQLENMITTLINYMKMNLVELRNKMQMESITAILKDFSRDAQITSQVFKRNFVIDMHLPEEEIFVPMDKQLVIRAMENLFSNALRYTKDNDTISFIVKIYDNQLYFTIKDTGIGISKEDLNNIFDLFYRGTNSRLEEGMGIGLSTVKNIVESHGWYITVQSELGLGSDFTVIIPLDTKAES